MGYTKGRADSVMGVVGSKLYNSDLFTLKDWSESIIDSVCEDANKDYRILAVDEHIGIPDYQHAFQSIDEGSKVTQGLTRAHVIRLGLKAGSLNPHITYNVDAREEGWLPRDGMPCAPGFNAKNWKKEFPSENIGNPISIKAISLADTAGQRQDWEYQVKYTGGVTKTWTRTSPGVTNKITADNIKDLLSKGFRRQRTNEVAVEQIKASRASIADILRSRIVPRDTQHHWGKYAFIE